MDSGARTLRAIWWDHFVDRDVLSALLGITWRQWTVAEYLKYARYRPALLKVAAEHRNLLPVLMEINPQQWGRDDLFSRKLWVRDGRKSTAHPGRPTDESPDRPFRTRKNRRCGTSLQETRSVEVEPDRLRDRILYRRRCPVHRHPGNRATG